ncbi:MAG TPA: hypothetical protein VJ111_10855, partial [Chitinophagaceae bacterium]|nr:hypothetical protein [Chitinophagaceae bacterium]
HLLRHFFYTKYSSLQLLHNNNAVFAIYAVFANLSFCLSWFPVRMFPVKAMVKAHFIKLSLADQKADHFITLRGRMIYLL